MSFGTVINCMDGRIQLPVINFLMERFGVEYIDNVTAAGPVRVLSGRNDGGSLQSIIDRVDISVNCHKSGKIAVVGHYDCAGVKAELEEHKKMVSDSVEFFRNKYPNTDVIGLWVDSSWKVSELPVG